MNTVDHQHVAELPRYVREHSRWIIEIPIRIVIIIVAALVVRVVAHRAITRLVRPVAVGLRSERRSQRAATVGSVLKSAVSFTILLIAFLLILSELRVNLAPFIAGTSIVGVAVAFGAQNIVKDFLSGMFMMLEDQYGVGDVIDFEKATGTVEAVGLRTTRLRDVNGTVWYVRNGEVVRVGNKSQGYAQVVLDVPIDATADVDRASEAILEVAVEMRNEQDWATVFLGDPEMQGVERLTREETVIRLVAKVQPLEQWRTARELRRRIRERLDRLGVESNLPSADPGD